MKAKPMKRDNELQEWILCPVEEATHIELRLPCPLSYRMLPIILKGSRDANKEIVWSWNGNTDKPTLKPSILTKGGRWDKEMTKYTEYTCHSFVIDGMVQFLSDCTHENVNKTLDLNDIKLLTQ